MVLQDKHLSHFLNALMRNAIIFTKKKILALLVMKPTSGCRGDQMEEENHCPSPTYYGWVVKQGQ